MKKQPKAGGKVSIYVPNDSRQAKKEQMRTNEARTMDMIDAVNELQKTVDLCDYCGKRPAYKTNSTKRECENHAFTGDCERPYVTPVPKHPPRISPKIYRNELCHCGSGKKFKRCCMSKMQ